MFRYEDMVSAGTLTKATGSPIAVTAATPQTLTPPIANPKAIRLYCAGADVYVETGATPATPGSGSYTIPAGVAEFVCLSPGFTVAIDVSVTASVQATWLS